MRYILPVLLAFVTTFASAQVQFLGSPTTTVRNRGNFVSDSLFYLPKRQVAPSDTAAMRYAIADSSVYVWTGNAWRRIGRAGASFLSVSDTSSMLTPYLREADTTAMLSPYYRSAQATAALALKVNISDTSSMLGNYIRHAGNGLTKSGQALSVDTASIATRARVQKAVDSLGAVKGSGTVTSVSAGTGMSFTTITSTGAVAADTTVLSTRAWRQKGDDSLASLISARVRISDTASMLNPYVRGSGTSDRIPKWSANTRTLIDGSIVDLSTTERLRITSDGELLIGTTTDAGAYALQVAGSIYNTTGAVLAASSGEVYFGGTTDQGAYIIQAYGGLYNTGSVILSATTGIVGVGGAGSSVGTGYSTVDARGENTTNTGAFRVSSSDYSRDAQWYMLSGNMFFGTVSNHDIIFTTNATNQLRLTNGGDFGVGTMSPTYKLDVSGTIRTTTTLTTGAPTSGSAKPWRLGEAATVSPTSPNRTIRVEIDGTVYYLHAKTTND